mmetsp:Transcript_109211/g.348622  ORF Transcript_109211/g.348622 Transcript_109211/m.348622 type:complete len:203 (-) Transcript_109211:551-1159(-)
MPMPPMRGPGGGLGGGGAAAAMDKASFVCTTLPWSLIIMSWRASSSVFAFCGSAGRRKPLRVRGKRPGSERPEGGGPGDIMVWGEKIVVSLCAGGRGGGGRDFDNLFPQLLQNLALAPKASPHSQTPPSSMGGPGGASGGPGGSGIGGSGSSMMPLAAFSARRATASLSKAGPVGASSPPGPPGPPSPPSPPCCEYVDHQRE